MAASDQTAEASKARRHNSGSHRPTVVSVGSKDMEDLKRRIEAQESATKSLEGKLTNVANDVGLQTGAIQRVEGLMKEIKLTLGVEEEDGTGGYKGTGIIGRTRRTEKRMDRLDKLYHRWMAFGAGVIFTVGSCAALVWWLVGDKIGIVLKGHP